MTVPVAVRFSDLDVFNHVNNVAFFELMETARVEFMRSRLRPLMGTFVLARAECDYRSEIRGGTRSVDITVSVEAFGTTSFTLLHEIRHGETLCGVGRTVQVVLDEARQASRPLSDTERALLES